MKKQPAELVNMDNDGLPQKKTSQVADPLSLRHLIIAPPGWGKTELFTSFPDSLLLACEEGHMFVEGYKIIIDSWEGTLEKTDDHGNLHLSFVDALARIESTNRFKFIVIDTVDALAKMCVDWHLENVESRSKEAAGKDALHLGDLGDFGKGYDLGMNTPMRQAFNIILKSGRGIGYITHQEMKTYDFTGKAKKIKKETTLPNGLIKLLFPQCDIIMHGEFGEKREGQHQRDRIIRTEGTEELLAKNRGGILPPAFVVPLDVPSRWQQFNGFFDPKTGKQNIEKAFAEFNETYDLA